MGVPKANRGREKTSPNLSALIIVASSSAMERAQGRFGIALY